MLPSDVLGNSFDEKKFMQLIYENNLAEAVEYKNTAIPKRLYKYFPLFDEQRNGHEEENSKRINSLLEGQLWVSKYDMLNDPFEYKMLYLDRAKIEEHGWSVKALNDFLEDIKNSSLTTCFSGETENNMPMWAHYANNHRGYCISYKVIKPELITPVFYESKRVAIASIATNLISAFQNKNEDQMLKYSTLYNLSLCCKHSLWKYENEYRLIYPELNLKNGKLIALKDIGLEVESIFVGYKTEPALYEQLLKIGDSVECNVYRMEFNEYSEDFKLVSQKIR